MPAQRARTARNVASGGAARSIRQRGGLAPTRIGRSRDCGQWTTCRQGAHGRRRGRHGDALGHGLRRRRRRFGPGFGDRLEALGPRREPPAAERKAVPAARKHDVRIAAQIRQCAFASAIDAEDGRQHLARRELQPGFLAVVEHLHGRHGGIARQLPVETEALRGRPRRLPGRSGGALAGQRASSQAGQACRHEEESNHASPRAKGASEAMRMTGMVDERPWPRQTGMYAWMKKTRSNRTGFR
jgi:hypothetical protein